MGAASGPSPPPNGGGDPGNLALRWTSRSSLPIALPPGTVLGDHYRLTGTLKVGRAATVYRGEEVGTTRPVSVKVFHEVGRHERNRIQSLRRPASNRVPQSALSSAFVPVRACDLTDDGRLFLVTEVVAGTSLADLLRRSPSLPPPRALELATQIGETLEAALNLGLLDLPLTPSDIIVDDADRVRFLRSDVLTLRQIGLGEPLAASEVSERDPRYAAPEELAGLSVTERSVVYRFGVLIYEIACGSPPFDGLTRAEVRDRQLRPPRRLGSRVPGIPASLDLLVSRMLESDPMKRPGDPASILNDLWDATCHLRTEASPTPAEVAPPSTIAPGAEARLSQASAWAIVGFSVIIIAGTLMAWPYLARDPSAPSSVPIPARSAVPGSSPPASVVESTGNTNGDLAREMSSGVPSRLAPSLASPSSSSAAAPSAAASLGDSGASLPRSDQRAPVARATAPPEGAPARIPTGTPSIAPTPGPAPRAASPSEPTIGATTPPANPGLTPARAIPELPLKPEPGAPAAPTTRPRPTPPESAGATDPTAIIDWLVRESPRISE